MKHLAAHASDNSSGHPSRVDPRREVRRQDSSSGSHDHPVLCLELRGAVDAHALARLTAASSHQWKEGPFARRGTEPPFDGIPDRSLYRSKPGPPFHLTVRSSASHIRPTLHSSVVFFLVGGALVSYDPGGWSLSLSCFLLPLACPRGTTPIITRGHSRTNR